MTKIASFKDEVVNEFSLSVHRMYHQCSGPFGKFAGGYLTEM